MASAGLRPSCESLRALLSGVKLIRLGVNRTAYVMCKTNLTHEDAFMFVQSRRFCVAPRVEFQHQLEVCFLECLGLVGRS